METKKMADEQGKVVGKPTFRLATSSWVAIIVGLIMLATGVILDLDARSLEGRYTALAAAEDSAATKIEFLQTATVTNTTNIKNLTDAVDKLRSLVETHILGPKGG